MGCQACSDDAFFDVFYRRQAQMFGRCDIAEEIGTARTGNGTTDCAGDVVIARCNIGNQRSQYIERGFVDRCTATYV